MVAHGRKSLMYSPVKPADIYVVFEAFRLAAVTIAEVRFRQFSSGLMLGDSEPAAKISRYSGLVGGKN
ncbi:MAG: hypothetical protein BWK80_30350 [Desulfobacteraceae bacterium IS3]|nr:MAG: hypothetical protein BWK80_30350 [Desulfobacteraceae bacterium IS3]